MHAPVLYCTVPDIILTLCNRFVCVVLLSGREVRYNVWTLHVYLGSSPSRWQKGFTHEVRRMKKGKMESVISYAYVHPNFGQPNCFVHPIIVQPNADVPHGMSCAARSDARLVACISGTSN